MLKIHKGLKIYSSNADLGTPSQILTSSPPQPQLTQKEYLIAVRNRLFTVEEQIWLHEYAIARTSRLSSQKIKGAGSPPPPPSPTGEANAPKTIEPLSESKYNELLRARGDLLDEYPLTKLYTDLYDAQKNNLTYAAIYLDRLINNFNRQMPLSMEHVNQIAVLSYSGQVNKLKHISFALTILTGLQIIKR